MEEIKYIDGYEFRLISDGLYKTDTPYEITEDWVFSTSHDNMSVMGPCIDGVMYAEYVSVNSVGSHEIVKLLNSNRKDKCYMEGFPSTNALGVVEWQ